MQVWFCWTIAVRDRMADVIVGLRILPKTVDVDLDKLEKHIEQLIKPEGMKREPIAFGLVAIHVTKIIPDAGGELEKLKEKLKTIPEIGEIDVTGLTRSL